MTTVLMLVIELIRCTNIKTPVGSVSGWTRESRDGRQYMAFTGIPYGKPPVGSLRLKNPEPFGKWEGELDATKDGPICFQYNFFHPNPAVASQPIGSEDCLYLNVYVPGEAKNNLPVLFYIHGGGFQFGGPGPRTIADYIMDEDVILVTHTYRLNIFGFLSLENDLIPGNFGLKDQALALSWVKDNIHSFGGDPDRIVLFGESAGAASVQHLLLSPSTRDLISGGFSTSGTISYVWSLSKPGAIKSHSTLFAESVGCHLSKEDILLCLQGADADDLLRATLNPAFAALAFRPCVEPDAPGAVIPFNPIGVAATKPWVTSFANGEHILGLMINALNDGQGMKKVDTLEGTLSFITRLHPNETDKLTKIKARYIDADNGQDVALKISHIYGDAHLVYPAIDSVKNQPGTKYLYTFEHRGKISLADAFLSTRTKEAAHGDELLYEFNMATLFGGLQMPEADIKISKDFIKLLANFAAFQNPTPNGSSVEWKPWTGSEVLRITSKGNVMADRHFIDKLDDLYEFWKPIL